MAWKYLKHNKASWGPQNVLVVDTETTRTAADGRGTSYLERFRCGVAKYRRLRGSVYSGSESLSFTDRETFWQFIERKATPSSVLWVFAHNVGFDSRVLGLWRLLDCGRFTRQKPRDRSKGSKSGQRRSEIRSGLLITGDPPTVVEVFARNGGVVKFVDTLNYWPLPLRDIGQWVGLEKLPMPDPWADDSEWFTYCERDVEILRLAIEKYVHWVSENELGIFCLTMPSQAMHGYRHTMACKRIVIHDEKEVQKLESEGYLGGEVYCGFIGQVDCGPGTKKLSFGEIRTENTISQTRQVHHLDCNSLFPAVMADKLYPCKLLEWRTGGDGKRSMVDRLGPDCIAECLLTADDYPVYARRNGRSGRWSGTFVAVLCGPELMAAVERGIVLAVRRYARYQLADLFSSFVHTHWTKRWACQLAGNVFESTMHKRLLNSLYGKWAQRSFQWEDCPELTYPEKWGCWVDLDFERKQMVHYRAVAGTVQRSVERGYHPNAFVAISAFTTAYARERMRSLRQIAGERQVYYQGIDSLYVTDLGLERLTVAGEVDRGALGKLRLEASAENAAFMGWGLYRFGDRWVRTSIGRGAIECVPGEFEQQNFQRLESTFAEQPVDGVQVTTVKRTLAASSPVGIIGPDGWVSPMAACWGDGPAESIGGEIYGSLDIRDWPGAAAPAH